MQCTERRFPEPPRDTGEVPLRRPRALNRAPRLEVQTQRARLDRVNMILMQCAWKIWPQRADIVRDIASRPVHQKKSLPIPDPYGTARRHSPVAAVDHNPLGDAHALPILLAFKRTQRDNVEHIALLTSGKKPPGTFRMKLPGVRARKQRAEVSENGLHLTGPGCSHSRRNCCSGRFCNVTRHAVGVDLELDWLRFES